MIEASAAVAFSAKVQVDHPYRPADALSSSFLAHWLRSGMHHVRTVHITRSCSLHEVVPADAVVESTTEDSFEAMAVASGAGYRLLVHARSSSTTVDVAASAEPVLDAVTADLQARLQPAEDTDEIIITVRSGHSTRQQPVWAPRWEDIARNYPSTVQSHLSDLLSIEGPAGRGRLVLWHGSPGTGKTTAIRALARSWKGWCDAIYVIDPEELFRDADYLAGMLASPSRSVLPPTLHTAGRQTERWRLVVAEDADEFLRANARHEAGAALGRLLNVTDGLLGDRMKVLVLLTTNEDVARLHPALVRPGRCLAQVHFADFARNEASEWLGRPATMSMTLAELLSERGDLAVNNTGTAQRSPLGAYL